MSGEFGVDIRNVSEVRGCASEEQRQEKAQIQVPVLRL